MSLNGWLATRLALYLSMFFRMRTYRTGAPVVFLAVFLASLVSLKSQAAPAVMYPNTPAPEITSERWLTINKAFYNSVLKMSREEKLEKIIELQQEVRKYRMQVAQVEDLADIERVNYDIYVALQKTYMWFAVITIGIGAAISQADIGAGGFLGWFTKTLPRRVLIVLPVGFLFTNWALKANSERKLKTHLALKHQMDLRLQELEDRLYLLEKLLLELPTALREEHGGRP